MCIIAHVRAMVAFSCEEGKRIFWGWFYFFATTALVCNEYNLTLLLLYSLTMKKIAIIIIIYDILFSPNFPFHYTVHALLFERIQNLSNKFMYVRTHGRT